VEVGVGVLVGTGVSVGVLAGTGVSVGVLVGTGVSVGVLVSTGVGVGVLVGIGGTTITGVAVGVGVGSTASTVTRSVPLGRLTRPCRSWLMAWISRLPAAHGPGKATVQKPLKSVRRIPPLGSPSTSTTMSVIGAPDPTNVRSSVEEMSGVNTFNVGGINTKSASLTVPSFNSGLRSTAAVTSPSVSWADRVKVMGPRVAWPRIDAAGGNQEANGDS